MAFYGFNSTDDIRNKYPAARRDTDLDIITRLSEQSGEHPSLIAHDLGINYAELTKQSGVIGGGMASAWDATKADVQGLGAGLAKKFAMPGVSDTLSNYAIRNQKLSMEEGRPDLENLSDQTLGSALPFVGYQVSKGFTGLAPFIVGTALAPEAAIPSALSRLGAVAPRVLGGAALDAGASFAERRAAAQIGKKFGRNIVGGVGSMEALGTGGQYNQAINNGEDADIGSAALDALPSSLIMGVAPGAAKGMITRGTGFEGGLLARTAKSMGVEGGVFAGLNTGSTLADVYNDPNLTPEQKRLAVLNSAASGFVTGAALGTIGGLHNPHAETNLVGKTEEETKFGGYLPNYAHETMIQFPDGSVGTRAQAEDWIKYHPHLDEDGNRILRTHAEQLEARAKLLGYEPQESEKQLLSLPSPNSEYEGGTLIVFPDGSVGSRDHAEHFIKFHLDDNGKVVERPEEEQSAVRAQLMGLGAQEVNRAEFPQGAIKQPQMSLQDFINSQYGLAEKTGADYKAADEKPSGVWVIDPVTQQERQLTMGERSQILQGYGAELGKVISDNSKTENEAAAKAAEDNWNYRDPETGDPLPTPKEIGAKFEARRNAYMKAAEARSKGLISNEDFQNITNVVAQYKRTGELGARVDKDIAEAIDKQQKLSVSDEEKTAQGYIKITDANGNVRWETPEEKANRGIKGGTDAGEITPLDGLEEKDRQLVKGYLGLGEDGKPSDTEVPKTLQELAEIYGVKSKETIRKKLASLGYTEKTKREMLAEREAKDLADDGGEQAVDEASAETYAPTLSDEVDKNDLHYGENDNPNKLSITKSGTVGDTGTGKGWKALLKRFGTEGLSKIITKNGEREPLWSNDHLQEAIASGELSKKNLEAVTNEVKRRMPGATGSESRPTDTWKNEKDAANRRFEQTMGMRHTEYQHWLNGRFSALLSANEAAKKFSTEISAEFSKFREDSTDPHFEDLSPNDKAIVTLAFMESEKYPQAVAFTVKDVLDEHRTNARTAEGEERADNGAAKTVDSTAGTESTSRPRDTENTKTVRETHSAESEDKSRQSVGKVENPSKASDVEKRIRKLFLSPGRFKDKVLVIQSEREAIKAGFKEEDVRGSKGITVGNKVILIADNIEKGRELGVFLHEMGVHVGFEKLIGKANMEYLSKQIERWAGKDDGSVEAEIAKAVKTRIEAAKEQNKNWDASDDVHESIAYFIEEAVNRGIDPLAVKELGSKELTNWFRRFVAAVKVALRKIGLGRFEDMKAQDLVDLAYGAADMELNGTWHGTAADFRKFDHRYMGTGEGNQAYGWGSYLAQRLGIAQDYHKQDVKRKSKEFVSAKEALGVDKEIKLSPVAGGIRSIDPTSNVKERAGKLYVEVKTVFDNGLKNFDYVSANELKSANSKGYVFDASVNDNAKKVRSAIDDSKPDGSLMRTRSLIGEHEMLDWDKPLDEQNPEITKLLEGPLAKYVEKAKRFVGEGEEPRGQQLYHVLMDAALEGDKDVLGDNTPADAMKAASMFLDKLGIKGNKYLDATSREEIVEANRINRLIDGWETEIDNIWKKYGPSEDPSMADASKLLRLISSIKQANEKLDTLTSRTENHVIFNDKNLVRMATYEGGDATKIRHSRNYTEDLVEKLPEGVKEPVRYVADTAADWAKRGVNYLMFTSDLAEKAAKRIPAAATWVEKMNRKAAEQARREGLVHDIADKADRLGRREFVRTFNLIHEVTKDQKVPYQPKWDGFDKTVTVDAETARKYSELTQAEKDVFDEVFKHGWNEQREVKAILKKTVQDEYATKIDKAKTDEEKEHLAKEQAKYEKLIDRKLATMDWYAPMRRVGSHVVIAMSERYAKAKADGEDLTDLRTDPNHYWLEFTDSQAEANAIKRKLDGKYGEKNVKAVPKDASRQYAPMLPFEAFDRIREMAKAFKGDASENMNAISNHLNNLIDELYLSSLVETSARKSEMRREGIPGLNADTIYRAFLSKGRASAHYISTLTDGKATSDAFEDMHSQALEHGTADAMNDFNELAKRYAATSKYDPSPVINKIMGFTSVWSLLSKPAYYFYNATQPALMTQPYLAEKFGYSNSGKEMMRAYKELAKVRGYFKSFNLEMTNLPKDVQQAMHQLYEMGKLDITIAQDLGRRITESRTRTGRAANRVMHALTGVAQKVETTNRLVTGIAAYRLAIKSGASHADAVKYAAKSIDHTQGDYSNFNAPRAFNQTGFQRVATQFRKFQLIQLSFMVRMMKDMDYKTPEGRAAMKAFGYVLGHHALLAGAMGLPFMNLVQLAYNNTGSANQPRDLELDMRKALGNGELASLIAHGAPTLANINLSGNVGAGQMTSLMPFTDIDVTKRDGYGNMIAGAMGPFIGGIGAQAWDAMGAFHRGDYYRFLEGISPYGARTALKAFREASSGMTNTKGDVLISPEEISLWDSMVKATGMKTESDSVRQLVRRDQVKFEEFFRDRTSILKNQYAQAYLDGDREGMQEARDNWMEMQQFKRDYGFKSQPLSNLLKAPAERTKRERQRINGIEVNKGNRGFVENYTEGDE